MDLVFLRSVRLQPGHRRCVGWTIGNISGVGPDSLATSPRTSLMISRVRARSLSAGVKKARTLQRDLLDFESIAAAQKLV